MTKLYSLEHMQEYQKYRDRLSHALGQYYVVLDHIGAGSDIAAAIHDCVYTYMDTPEFLEKFTDGVDLADLVHDAALSVHDDFPGREDQFLEARQELLNLM